MNSKILDTDIQLYISEHLHQDPAKISLSKSPFKDVSSKELAEQIDSKKRSEKKLPLWYETAQIYFPQKLSIEQCSSELTAQYKSDLIKGDKVVDITGGFGVDSYFFSKKAKLIFHCEIDVELSSIASHNARVLGADNIHFIVQDGIAFLNQAAEKFDTIYIDPSRRIKTQKVFLLKDCEPDVVNNLELLLAKANRIIIKTSPMLDITSGLNELKHVSEIYIVSVKNDCKEILWVIDKHFEGEPTINCVAITDKKTQTLSLALSEEKGLSIDQYLSPQAGNYIYEPDAAILKAGFFKLLTQKFKIAKIAPSTHLYLGNSVEEDFIGKIYQVLTVIPYKDLSKHKFVKANVITRNFPLKATELKKKHKIEEGGDDFLLFVTNSEKQLLTLHAKRV